MSQTEGILNYLKTGHSITSLEALNKFSCLRLSAIIFILKEDGNNIKSERITTRDGKNVAKYYM